MNNESKYPWADSIPESERPPIYTEVNDLNMGVNLVKALADEHMEETGKKQVLIVVLGNPDAGKTHFIKAFGERFGMMEGVPYPAVTGATSDHEFDSQRENIEIARYILVHEVGVSVRPDIISYDHYTRKADMIVYLYTSESLKHGDWIQHFRSKIDLIIRNDEATPKSVPR